MQVPTRREFKANVRLPERATHPLLVAPLVAH
jgi:hypothetical protein